MFSLPISGPSLARVLVEMSRPGVAGFAAVDEKAGEITGYNPHRMRSRTGISKRCAQTLHSAWVEKLGRLELEGATNRERTRLYTALYHSLLYRGSGLFTLRLS